MKGRPLWTLLSARCCSLAASSSAVPSRPASSSRLRLRQVLVVHRHGDRSPITPLRDASYWRTQLPDRRMLDGIAEGTTLLRPSGGGPTAHGAVGRVPFGQLTTLGLLQMVGLGERLREELALGPSSHDEGGEEEEMEEDGEGHRFSNRGRLFTPEEPLHPSRVRVMSTDFPRTIQSVQAVLTGLFPDADHDEPIEIDLRHTNAYFIPDPQPRQHDRQLSLERYLSRRPHLARREGELRGLARRVTDALEGQLGEGAGGVSFGIGEEKEDASSSGRAAGTAAQRRRRPTLAWAQMAELLVCLHSRGLLPPGLSEDDVGAVSDHVAWRWFENLDHPVLAKAAMSRFAAGLVETMRRRAEERDDAAAGSAAEPASPEPRLCLYSAHDSTLIGLLCVLRLERPAAWPEYGSALKAELIAEEGGTGEGPSRRHWVRFSLNGQVLRNAWRVGDDGEPAAMVPLEELADMIHAEHELFEEEEDRGSRLRYSWKDGSLKEH